MNREYFQDIVTHDKQLPHDNQRPADESANAADEPRGIRTIEINRRASGSSNAGTSMRRNPPMRPRRSSGLRWIAAIVGILAIGIILALVVFRATTVVITPRSQHLSLDPSSHITAYPAATAATGTLSYTVTSVDLDDVALLPKAATDATPLSQTSTSSAASSRVSGSVTVYNNYSKTSIRLVKNTRFQSQDGHIFRSPFDVVVPGRTADGAGFVSVVIVADQPGAGYAVAPGKFTVPGLKSNPNMYSQVYAQSSAQFSSSGSAVSAEQGSGNPNTRAAAIANLRSRMEAKIRTQVTLQTSAAMTVLPDLIQFSYQDTPDTTDADGVHIHEHTHALVPVFPSVALAQAIAQPVIADPSNANINVQPGNNFAAHLIVDESGAAPAAPVLGTDPILFSLSGNAIIVWNIDVHALSQALAGRDTTAFNSIVANFASIQSAKANIEPFWQSTFPTDPSQITVVVQQP